MPSLIRGFDLRAKTANARAGAGKLATKIVSTYIYIYISADSITKSWRPTSLSLVGVFFPLFIRTSHYWCHFHQVMVRPIASFHHLSDHRGPCYPGACRNCSGHCYPWGQPAPPATWEWCLCHPPASPRASRWSRCTGNTPMVFWWLFFGAFYTYSIYVCMCIYIYIYTRVVYIYTYIYI